MNCAQGGVLGYFALLEGPHSPWQGGCSWPMGQAGFVWRSNKCVWQLLLLKGCFVVGAPFNKVFWGVFGFCAVRTLFFLAGSQTASGRVTPLQPCTLFVLYGSDALGCGMHFFLSFLFRYVYSCGQFVFVDV